ncbi:MAG: hypothetical protein HC907_22070 [Richelia sp. SM1_7_0]|nr:hypothetical protein [Richelia sp. SM1_7_0]
MNYEKVSIEYKLIKALIETSNYLVKELEVSEVKGSGFDTAKLVGKYEYIVQQIDEVVNEQMANQILVKERYDC